MNGLRRLLRRPPSWAWPLLLLALSLPAGNASAQDGSRDRSELEARIRARFAEIVRERLGLDEQQEATLAAVVASFQDDRRELAIRQRALYRRIRALELDDRTPEVDVTTASAILREMVAVRVEEVRIAREEQEALLGILGPIQVLQFLELREDMADYIRRNRGRHGGEGFGRRDGSRYDGARGERADGSRDRSHDRPPGPERSDVDTGCT